MNILGISGFLFEFLLNEYSYLNHKKRIHLPTGADVASRPGWQADVAHGTTARMRRGTETTWQGRGWPARGACGA